jgi:alkyl hydroperoxide reductase subunit F
MLYDLVIVGGGPAGVAAGIYAARKKMRAVVIAESFGGQSIVSADVQNWIGTKSISGVELAKALEDHLRVQEDIKIADGARASDVLKTDAGFKVKTEDGKSFETKTVLIASGGRHKRLGVPGENKFDGRGVSYCSICDAPIFKGKDVAVTGSGNAGLEAVVDLLPYASRIYLLIRGDILKGDPVTQERIAKEPKVRIIFNAVTTEITGNNFMSGLKYKDSVSGEIKELSAEGMFVEIGAVPNTELVKDLVELSPMGAIVTDAKTQRASLTGIWAAGDVTDGLYRQNNISAGDAVKAVLNIYDYLNKNK